MSHIQIYDNILSQKNCDEIIEIFEKSQSPYKVKGVVGDKMIVNKELKDSIDLSLSFNSPDNEGEYKINQYVKNTLSVCTEKYKKKYPFLMETHIWNVDDEYNIQKFSDGGGYYSIHCEVSPQKSKRILVWMIYLNNAKCGTRFYYPKRDIKARRGRVVIWPAFWTHPHSGITPNKGDKYILTGWFSYQC
jgi:hypothetical protein